MNGCVITSESTRSVTVPVKQLPTPYETVD